MKKSVENYEKTFFLLILVMGNGIIYKLKNIKMKWR